MSSKGSTQKKVIMLSYKDLVRRIKGELPQQVEKGDPEWDNGVACIKAYHSQATVLSQADQEEMRDIIRRLDYVIRPSAQGTPSSHKLMRAHNKLIKRGRSPSWPVFLILKALYGKTLLPTKYVRCIREAFGTAEVDDHTNEYLAIEGTEPAEPAESAEPAPKTSVVEISSSPSTSEDQYTTEEEDVGDDATEDNQQTNKRDASVLDIEDCRSSANKRTKVTGASSLHLPVNEINNRDRHDIMARYARLAKAFSENRTAQEVGCERTIGKIGEMIDKKLEAMQDAGEKKMEENFEAQTKELQMTWEDLEKKMEEKFQAQTKELQMIRELFEKNMEKFEAQTKELQMIRQLLEKNTEEIQMIRDALKFLEKL